MTKWPEKGEGPAHSVTRVDSIERQCIILIDKMIRQDHIEYKDLMRLVLGNIAYSYHAGDRQRVSKKVRLVTEQLKLLKDLIRSQAEIDLQESMANKLNAIEIELQKDNPR